MRLLGSTLEAIAREKGGIVKKGIPLIAGPKAAPFFPYGDPVLPCSAPFYDAENSAIAQAVLQRLGLAASSIAHGIACRPSCRFQILGSTILDVAHNVSGFERLIEALQFHFPKEKFHFIVAFSKDKEWEKCLQLIEPHAAHISLIGGLNPRLAPLGRLALTEVLGTRKEREVICGSFYLMAEALEILGASLNLS
jgi:dihydrofolate synthase/folylpolyglutamate synthase